MYVNLLRQDTVCACSPTMLTCKSFIFLLICEPRLFSPSPFMFCRRFCFELSFGWVSEELGGVNKEKFSRLRRKMNEQRALWKLGGCEPKSTSVEHAYYLALLDNPHHDEYWRYWLAFQAFQQQRRLATSQLPDEGNYSVIKNEVAKGLWWHYNYLQKWTLMLIRCCIS